MESKLQKSRLIPYIILSILLFFLVLGLSLNPEQSIIVTILFAFLVLLLTQWHIIFGLISPTIREYVWTEDDNYDKSDNEMSEGFINKIQVWGIIILFAIYIDILVILQNQLIPFNRLLGLTLYIIGPSVLLSYRHWLTMSLSIIWVWFPIEWGVIDDILNNLRFELLPLDALIGLVALVLPAVLLGRHIPWFDWKVGKEDLYVANKSIIGVSLIIVPFGILLNFLTFNPANLLNPDVKLVSNPVLNSIVYAVFVFFAIFLVQGLMEETLFRDFIFKHHYYWLQDKNMEDRGILGITSIVAACILVASTPFWDEALQLISQILPIFDPLRLRIGNLALPLGEYEGAAIPFIEEYPVWPFYILVAVLLLILGLIIYSKSSTPLMAALITSSIIFGWAHFQDFRYVFFASIAGFGYGYTYYKTKNIVPAAMVHMGVDAVWVLLLQY